MGCLSRQHPQFQAAVGICWSVHQHIGYTTFLNRWIIIQVPCTIGAFTTAATHPHASKDYQYGCPLLSFKSSFDTACTRAHKLFLKPWCVHEIASRLETARTQKSSCFSYCSVFANRLMLHYCDILYYFTHTPLKIGWPGIKVNASRYFLNQFRSES